MGRFKPGADHAVYVLVALFVTLFIGMDIADSAGWDWRSWLRPARAALPPAPGNPEIRKYVEFTTVRHQSMKITTGIRFDNSASRKIETQWCYAELIDSNSGGLEYQLNIGRADAHGPIKVRPFSAQALSQFGLTQGQARALVKHCRFKKQPRK